MAIVAVLWTDERHGCGWHNPQCADVYYSDAVLGKRRPSDNCFKLFHWERFGASLGVAPDAVTYNNTGGALDQLVSY
jgi:hypothetical protein